jgi:DNA (cytosine-5)-methyltransferase 1
MSALRVGSLFSGIGGLDLAVEAFFGGSTAWHVEWEPEPSKVLAAHWPGVPNFGDVTTVDWSTVEPVDIICGGFPCQDLSLAGRRSGMRPGTRSGLWADFRKAIAALRPSVVLIENVRGLLSGCAESESDSKLGPCPRCADPESGVQHAPNLRALGRVLIDLAALGFDAEWHALPASDIGAPHGRFRVFVLAYARGVRLGSRWDAIPGEATGGRASAVAGGRADAPLTLLPTPVAQPSGNTPENHLRKKPGRSVVTDLAILVENDLMKTGGRLLPTPTTMPDTGNGHARNLGAEVKLLPTPAAADGSGGRVSSEMGGTRESGAKRSITLATAVHHKLLPTPTTAYATGGNAVRGGDRSGEKLLPGIARDVTDGETVDWGEYLPAVQRWEAITRSAPSPTLPDGKNGNRRLSAAFDEWMMGYPAGWVTDVIGWNAAIKACGNGVVPQQAHAALGVLWPRVREAVAS